MNLDKRPPPNDAQEMGSHRTGMSVVHACCLLSSLRLQAGRDLRGPSVASTTFSSLVLSCQHLLSIRQHPK